MHKTSILATAAPQFDQYPGQKPKPMILSLLEINCNVYFCEMFKIQDLSQADCFRHSWEVMEQSDSQSSFFMSWGWWGRINSKPGVHDPIQQLLLQQHRRKRLFWLSVSAGELSEDIPSADAWTRCIDRQGPWLRLLCQSAAAQSSGFQSQRQYKITRELFKAPFPTGRFTDREAVCFKKAS